MTEGGLRRSALEADERSLEVERVDQVLARGSLTVAITLDLLPISPAALSLEFENVALEASGPGVASEMRVEVCDTGFAPDPTKKFVESVFAERLALVGEKERLVGCAHVSLAQVAIKLFEDRIVDVHGAEFLALADHGAHGQEAKARRFVISRRA
jgi:hypothetical protein